MAHGDSTSRPPLKIDIVERCRVEQRLDLCAAVARRLRHHRPPERGRGGTAKEPRSCYGVSFPDVPGCISAGDTLDEAVSNAVGGFERSPRRDARAGGAAAVRAHARDAA